MINSLKNFIIKKKSKLISADLERFLGATMKLIFGNIITLLFSFIISVILARSLGVEGRGIVAWITSLIAIASVLVQFGISVINKRFVAEDNSKAGDLALFTILMIICISTLVAPFFYYYANSVETGKLNSSVVIIGLLTIPAMAIANSLAEIFVGLNQMRNFNLVTIWPKLFNAILIILLALFALLKPWSAMIALLLALLLQIFLIIFFLKKNIRLQFNFSKIKLIIHHLKGHMFNNYIAEILLIIAGAIPILILTSKNSVSGTGIFSVGMALINVVLTFFVSMGKCSLTMLSSITDTERQNKLKLTLIIISFIMAISSAIFLYSTAYLIVPLIFGKNFIEAVSVLKLLSIGLVFFALYNNMRGIIISESNGWLIIQSPLVVTLTIFILSLILIPSYGTIGAAYAWIIAGFFGLVSSSFILLKIRKNS